MSSRSAPSLMSISLILGLPESNPLKVSARRGSEGEEYSLECFSPAEDTDLDKFDTDENMELASRLAS